MRRCDQAIVTLISFLFLMLTQMTVAAVSHTSEGKVLGKNYATKSGAAVEGAVHGSPFQIGLIVLSFVCAAITTTPFTDVVPSNDSSRAKVRHPPGSTLNSLEVGTGQNMILELEMLRGVVYKRPGLAPIGNDSMSNAWQSWPRFHRAPDQMQAPVYSNSSGICGSDVGFSGMEGWCITRDPCPSNTIVDPTAAVFMALEVLPSLASSMGSTEQTNPSLSLVLRKKMVAVTSTNSTTGIFYMGRHLPDIEEQFISEDAYSSQAPIIPAEVISSIADIRLLLSSVCAKEQASLSVDPSDKRMLTGTNSTRHPGMGTERDDEGYLARDVDSTAFLLMPDLDMPDPFREFYPQVPPIVVLPEPAWPWMLPYRQLRRNVSLEEQTTVQVRDQQDIAEPASMLDTALQLAHIVKGTHEAQDESHNKWQEEASSQFTRHPAACLLTTILLSTAFVVLVRRHRAAMRSPGAQAQPRCGALMLVYIISLAHYADATVHLEGLRDLTDTADSLATQMLEAASRQETASRGEGLVSEADSSRAYGRQLGGRELSSGGSEASTSVDSSSALVAALADGAVGRIRIAPGHYLMSSQLVIERNVTIEAEVPGTVVLDGQGSTRVLNISAGEVILSGLNITGGYVSNENVSRSQCLILNHAPKLKSIFFDLLQGGGIWISGSETVVRCIGGSIHNNNAEVRACCPVLPAGSGAPASVCVCARRS